MVMHARKHPRLHDGYTDRHDPHLLQNTRYAEKSYRDNYNRMRELPYDRRRSVSPDEHKNTGYIHKSSYSEKNKERNERDSHNLSERKLNNVSSSMHRSTNDNHNGNDRSSKGNINNQQRDRADVHRPRGDWSEHVSSSGDKYYYNGKTGVSQWEKPKEWAEVSSSKSSDNRSKDGRHRQMAEKEDRSKHSNVDKNNDKYITSSTCSSYSKSSDKQLSHVSKEYKSSQSLDSERYSSHSSHRTNYSSDYSSSKDNFPIRRDTCYPYPSMDNYKRPRRDSDGPKSALTNTPVKGHDHRRGDDSEEMDVSPGSTPTSSRPNSRPSSCTSTPQCPPGSTPASSTPGHPVTVTAGSHSSSSCTASGADSLPQLLASIGGSNNQELAQKTLQTLQKLQEAINKQMTMAQQNLNQLQSPRSSGVEASPLQILKNLGPIQQVPPRIPEAHVQQNQEEVEERGNKSPASVHSHRSCRSPTPSTGSETGGNHEVSDGPIGNVGLSAAGIKKDVSGLTPSLSNYVNERLIGHVLGWQADHLERQANRYREEAITIGSLHCSQVSVELKKSRSLVRIAEIQSTLHEQRILFTAQQIKDLEHMKPPSYLLSD